MDTKPDRTCPTCGGSLPKDATRRQKYCCITCRKRGAKRKERGSPQTDRSFTPEEDAARSVELIRLRAENRKLRNLAARLSGTRRKYQRKAEAAADRIATARKRADAAELAVAQWQRQAGDTAAELRSVQRQLTDQKNLVAAHREDQEQLAAAEVFVGHLEAKLNKLAARTTSPQARLSQKVLRDWNFLASRYFRNRSPEMWNEHDHSIFKTWSAYRKQTPTPNKRTR